MNTDRSHFYGIVNNLLILPLLLPGFFLFNEWHFPFSLITHWMKTHEEHKRHWNNHLKGSKSECYFLHCHKKRMANMTIKKHEVGCYERKENTPNRTCLTAAKPIQFEQVLNVCRVHLIQGPCLIWASLKKKRWLKRSFVNNLLFDKHFKTSQFLRSGILTRIFSL